MDRRPVAPRVKSLRASGLQVLIRSAPVTFHDLPVLSPRILLCAKAFARRETPAFSVSFGSAAAFSLEVGLKAQCLDVGGGVLATLTALLAYEAPHLAYRFLGPTPPSALSLPILPVHYFICLCRWQSGDIAPVHLVTATVRARIGVRARLRSGSLIGCGRWCCAWRGALRCPTPRLFLCWWRQ